NPSNEYDTRKAIEREIEPYIFSIKNELRLMIDNFNKNVGDYNYIKPEINLVKESVMENKKLVLIFQEDFERKLGDYSQKFNMMNKSFDDMKFNFGDFAKKVKNFEKLYESLEDKIVSIDRVKDKLERLESNTEQYYKEIE